LYTKYLTKDGLEGFGDLKLGQVICIVKYADNLVLLHKAEAVLQGRAETPTEIGTCYEIDMWKN
jgi:hypothetical protein